MQNKKILLLDDIYTTGSTVNECSKVLKQAGIKEICYAEDYKNNKYAEELLKKSGIIVRKVDYQVEDVITRMKKK